MRLLGIHLDAPFIRIASLDQNRAGIKLHQLQVQSVEEALVKPLYTPSNWKSRTCSGLSAKDFLIRPLQLKIANLRHLDEAIAFQAEATSHFSPTEVLTVPLVQTNKNGWVEALLLTAPRACIETHLRELKKFEIDPDFVSTTPSALCSFIHWKFPNLSNAFLIDLGSNETTCILLRNGKLKKAHAFSIGIEKLLAALLEDRKRTLLKKEMEGAAKQIDLLLLKSSLNPHLASLLNEMKQEIGKIHQSYHREEEPTAVLFTGRTDSFIHLKEFLFDQNPHPWILTLEEELFSSSIGLALEQTNKTPIQFRREEFFPKKNWEKMGLYALLLLVLSLFFSALLGGIGNQINQSRKEAMFRSLPPGLTIEKWVASVEKNNKDYPYIPQSPKVHEVFSWLSTHPLLIELKESGDPIQLQKLHYQLVQFPKVGAVKEPYLAKVELEFQVKHATNARKFHEALRLGDELVNPQLEITWEPFSQGYRTTFYLKNRSPYAFEAF